MKKLVIVLLMSIPFALFAQEWTIFQLPTNQASAACVGQEMLVADEDQLYVSTIPESGYPPNWQIAALPVTGKEINDIAQVNGYVFILYRDGDLWQKSQEGWQLAYEEVEFIHTFGEFLYAYQEGFLLRFSRGWSERPFMPGLKAIAANDFNLMAFFANGEKTDIWVSSGFHEEFSYWFTFDMKSREAAMANGASPEYLVSGDHSLVTWYQTNLNLASRWVNCLGPGQVNSVTANSDGQYFAVGEVKGQAPIGFLVNTKDITSIVFVDEPMLKVRSGSGITAAITPSQIYLIWGAPVMAIAEPNSETRFSVRSYGNQLNVDVKEHTEFQIYDLSGRLLGNYSLSPGNHIISLDVPPGAYFAGGEMIIIP